MNNTHITVRGGFPREDLTKDKGPLVFKVSGIRSPRSLRTSSSMKVYTYDSRGFMIEFKTDQMTVTMLEVSRVVSA
jgi:hypothetical protein